MYNYRGYPYYNYPNNYSNGNYNNSNGYNNNYQNQGMINQPVAPQQNIMPQQNFTPLTFVNGIEGAKSYIIPANATIYLRDSDSNKIYIKSCDNEGKCTIKSFEMVDVDENIGGNEKTQNLAKFEPNNYISRDEFLTYGKDIESRIEALSNKLNKEIAKKIIKESD